MLGKRNAKHTGKMKILSHNDENMCNWVSFVFSKLEFIQSSTQANTRTLASNIHFQCTLLHSISNYVVSSFSQQSHQIFC